jgi:hypothetical protein
MDLPVPVLARVQNFANAVLSLPIFWSKSDPYPFPFQAGKPKLPLLFHHFVARAVLEPRLGKQAVRRNED